MASGDSLLSKYLYYSDSQENAIITTERVTSVISLLSCVLVFVTFLTSKRFRKPVNRLLFYATIGNFLMNVGTMISFAGIYAGQDSALCQLQGFLIQMFLPADAFWNLSMAINTYLAVFKKWSSSRLKRLDLVYLTLNYGCTFIVALVYCFVQNEKQGRMYGPAVLWCWIDSQWELWRIVTCYAPAWISIFASFCIYIASGIHIYRKRNQLQRFSARGGVHRSTTSHASHWSHQHIRTTTELRVTTHNLPPTELDDLGSKDEDNGYVCTAEALPYNPFGELEPTATDQAKQLASAKIEASTTAAEYAKCAMLFFVSLLITWVPSSIFRVALLVSPQTHIYGLAYTTSLVLCMQGHWNAIIYIVTSRNAMAQWLLEDLRLERVFVRLGLRKARPVVETVVWPPSMTPRARDRFVRKGSHTGSFDRLW